MRMPRAASVLLLLGVFSCAAPSYPPPHEALAPSAEELVAPEVPPPARVESVPERPSADHVWVAGYWTRWNGQWAWVDGRFVPRPSPGAAWTAGRWEARGSRWGWIPGRWN